MKSLQTLVIALICIAIVGCDDKATGSSSSNSTNAMIGDWSYGRLRDSMFDSATFSFQKDGSFNGVGAFNLLGAYYQIVYQKGSWKATADSLTLAIDTAYETRDYGKTFKAMTSKREPMTMKYYVRLEELGILIKDDDESIDTLKLKKKK